MAHPHTAAKIRVDNITAYLTPGLILLDELNNAFGLPYAQPIIKTTQALIVGLQVLVATEKSTLELKKVQNVKRNKDECFRLVENIHRVLYPIIRLHLKSETLGTPHLAVFEAIGAFTETLHKMYMLIQIQQDGNKIKWFFHQAEANRLLKDCRTGLDQAIEIFKYSRARQELQS
ncbi:hypothetical protein C8R46DRAFT_1032907 [Mycena filopes]|nr:hypothetical protein C8R46DRAFT_1032907 [Mycena filopes]